MSLIVLNQGEQAFLENGVTGVAYTLRLYSNDVSSGLTDEEIQALTEADFTEATFAGYSAAALATGDWSITQGNPTQAVNVEKSFIRSSTGTAELIYGYYVTRDSDGQAHWFEQFEGPVTIEVLDDQIDLTPQITLDDAEGNELEAGTIVMTGRETAPTGWLLCDGSAVSRSTFDALFAAIGTAYGVGDGSTTFNLPDLRQRFPLGKADAGTGDTLGGTGGDIDHVHDLATTSSGAHITFASTGSPAAFIERKTLGSWTATHQLSTGGASSGGNFTGGAALEGDSDIGNPPFQVVNYLVKT